MQQNRFNCNGVYPRIKDGEYLINLNEFNLIGTH